jgi:hypothetical protein
LPQIQGIRIHVPVDALEKEEMQSLKKEMSEKGYVVEECSAGVLERILGSLVP